MAKLVFDIETTALPLEGFDAGQVEYLFRDAENLPDPAHRLARRAEIQRFFSLWPLTGQVVCVAMANVDSFRSKVLFLGAEDKDKASRELPVSNEFVPCASEQELLTEFWEVAVRYESIITFNGRTFDVPFLYLRSALLNVRILRKDWLGYRFQVEPHCDLLEQLTFYGVSGRDGAARRFNLDFYCKAFGIPSPKGHGITGLDIGRLMAEGRAWDVAEYCLGDVQATAKLYNVWKERLSGIT
jgi:3'-5' exonuclease